MMGEPTRQPSLISALARVACRPLAIAVTLLGCSILSCSIYANLSYLVKDPADYRFFPPFEAGYNRNMNDHLGAEHYNIAKAVMAGRGYSDPFREPTGPTAWMPPVLPGILAGLLWATDNDTLAVTACVVLLQNLTLFVTALLILAITRQNVGTLVTGTAVFLLALAYQFRWSFQITHDCWIVLLLLDVLIGWSVWARPLGSARMAGAWGAFGGFCALTSPVIGFTWGVVSFLLAWRGEHRGRLAVAVLASGLTITPWVARNYFAFGRLIPVKSNLPFELYQSQCLQPDGVLRYSSFATHPYSLKSAEHREYMQLGETAYLDRKSEQFSDAFWGAVPLDFTERVGNRFFAATLLYLPFDPTGEAQRPWTLWLSRLVHPIPFLSLLVLLASSRRYPLTSAQWVVIGVYVVYLLPYVLISYYDRYVFPLIVVEVPLVVWGVDSANRHWLRPASETMSAATAPSLENHSCSTPGP